MCECADGSVSLHVARALALPPSKPLVETLKRIIRLDRRARDLSRPPTANDAGGGSCSGCDASYFGGDGCGGAQLAYEGRRAGGERGRPGAAQRVALLATRVGLIARKVAQHRCSDKEDGIRPEQRQEACSHPIESDRAAGKRCGPSRLLDDVQQTAEIEHACQVGCAEQAGADKLFGSGRGERHRLLAQHHRRVPVGAITPVRGIHGRGSKLGEGVHDARLACIVLHHSRNPREPGEGRQYERLVHVHPAAIRSSVICG
mmetsp:Transcript_12639/g.29667  ORF Transcript_12639/g.29667 Transcript_12639/m.29667 type:complete len:260 (-) Transcript_12639:763-1542(-)